MTRAPRQPSDAPSEARARQPAVSGSALEAGFRLGTAKIRPIAGTIEIGGAVRRVERMPMQVLLFLADDPRVTRTRDAILDTVWGAKAVGDDVLNVAVSALRKALGDDARAPRFIQTVPRAGYRLLGVPRPLERDAGRGGPTRRAVAWAVAALALVGIGLLLLAGSRSSGPEAHAPEAPEPLVANAPPDLSSPAIELLTRGRFLLARAGEALRSEEAIAAFEAAVVVDPASAEAHALLAEAWIARAGHDPMAAPEYLAAARDPAERAVRIAPSLARAQLVLGIVELVHGWNFDAAEDRLRRAVDLDPRDPDARFWLARLLKATGRYDQALAEARAQRALDPSSYGLPLAASILNLAGLEEEAAAEIRHQLEVVGADADLYCELAKTYDAMGRFDDAVTAYRTSLDLAGDQATLAWLDQTRLDPNDRVGMCHAWIDELDARRSRGFVVSSTDLAAAFVGAREMDLAMEVLERAYTRRDPRLVMIGAELSYAPLRADPRFTDLLRRIGL